MADIPVITPMQTVRPTSGAEMGQNVRVDTGSTVDLQQVQVDPNRVVRPNEQNVNTGDQAYQYRDSNFTSFIRTLQSIPDLPELFSELFVSKFTNQATLVSYGPEFAKQVNEFMETLNITPEKLLDLIKEQNVISNKFTGPFFDILRNMTTKPGVSRELMTTVLDFLKRYDAVTSQPHTENVMLSNLKSIAANIPKTNSDQLINLIKQYPVDSPDTEKLTFLKDTVMPFLTKYVSSTHDYGVARDMIAMFAVSLGKFETGNMPAFKESFQNLAGYMQIMGMLEGIDPATLMDRLLAGGNEISRESTEIVDAFIKVLMRGMEGEAGAANKASFSDMVSNILVNESVYMPLTHMVIPANIDGQMLFSEMWMDPDANNDAANPNSDDGERTSKIYVKFMIQELGDFDLIIMEREGKVNLELHYPETITDETSKIRRDISSIVRNNDLTVENLTVGKGRIKKNLIEIFPKIYSQKTTIDVSV